MDYFFGPHSKKLGVLLTFVLIGANVLFLLPNIAHADITTGLIGYWKFDETSGTTASDSAGANPGTLINNPAWTTGKVNNGLQFSTTDNGNDADDPRVNLGTNFNVSLPFTISAWVKPTDYNDYRAIFSKRDSYSSSNMRLDVGLNAGTGQAYVVNGSGGVNFSYAPAVNVWTNLTFVLTSSGTSLYVNGVLSQNLGAMTLGTDTTANTVIGGTGEPVSGGDNDPFKGAIDEVRVYNRALSTQDILDVYNYAGAPDTQAPSVPTNLSATAVSASQINLSWTASTDNVGVAGYKVFRNGSQVATSTVASYSNTGLTASTTYTYTVSAFDGPGNQSAQSSSVQATTFAPDTTPPVVSLTLPASGSTVSGSLVTVSANASDNVSVSGVQFKLDGANLGAEDTISPYSIVWDSTLSGNGSHTLSAVARDSANNTTTSSGVPVTVGNVMPTFVLCGAPAEGAATITPALPSGWLPNDIFLLFAETANQVVPATSGYTEITNSPQGTGTAAGTSATRLTARWRRAVSGDTAPTVGDSGDHQLAVICAFRGVTTTGNPWDVTSGNVEATSDSSLSATGATTSGNDSLIVVAAVLMDDAQNFGASWTNSSLTNITVILNAPATAGNDARLGVVTGGKAAAGVYGATTNTLTASSVKGMMTIALKPQINDTTAPVISAVAASSIATSTASISWITDELSNSQVEYGLTTAYGSQTTLNPSLVTSHIQPLSGLFASTLYHYRVLSRDNSGNLAISSDFVFTTADPPAPDTQSPTVPTGLSATSTSTSQINLVWSASSDNVGVTGYKIFRDGLQIATSTVTSFSNIGLNPSTTYSYTVAAFDAAQNQSSQSSSAQATTFTPDLSPPSVPTGLAATSTSSSKINLSWTASTDNVGVAGYKIFRNGNQITTTTAITYLDINLNASTTYAYAVAAFDAANNQSATSSSVSATTLAASSVNYGLEWTGNLSTTRRMLYWSNPFPIYDATYIFKVYPRQKTYSCNPGAPDFGSKYYTTFFWGNNGNFAWDGGNANTYYGGHPYPTPAPCGEGRWEISVAAQDITAPQTVQWNRWFTQAFRVWRESTTRTHHEFYYDLPDTSKVISYTVDGSNWASQNPPNPAIVIGQAPDLCGPPPGNCGQSWGGYPGWEEFNGIIRGIQMYSNDLSLADIQAEIANPESTTAGANSIWYLNLDPRPSDVTDKKSGGTPHNPLWDGQPALQWSSEVVDTTGPVISAVTASNITQTGATITWNTNEPADSQVQYGLTQSYGSQTSLDTTLVAAHSQTLSGLSSGTTYNFRVLSKDAATNQTTSTNFSFTTLSVPDITPPSVPTNLSATAVSASQINLSWTASTDNVGVLGYRIFRDSVFVATSTVTSFSNTGLNPSTTYVYTVSAFDSSGNESGLSASASATTFTPDTTAPIISSVSSSNITANTATISWITNEPADSQIQYGLTTAYGSQTTLNPTLLTSHSQVITGLNASTTYNYVVLSRDGSGNLAISSNFTFTTAVNTTIRINFQPGNVPVPPNYISDDGSTYAARNGQTYGWNVNNQGNTRDRDNPISPDQRYDTLTHMNGSLFWEIALPNGTYTVRIVSGDPSNFDVVAKVLAEGVLVVNANTSSSNPWVEGTQAITVTDGRLTLTSGSGAYNKLNFIEITP